MYRKETILIVVLGTLLASVTTQYVEADFDPFPPKFPQEHVLSNVRNCVAKYVEVAGHQDKFFEINTDFRPTVTDFRKERGDAWGLVYKHNVYIGIKTDCTDPADIALIKNINISMVPQENSGLLYMVINIEAKDERLKKMAANLLKPECVTTPPYGLVPGAGERTARLSFMLAALAAVLLPLVNVQHRSWLLCLFVLMCAVWATSGKELEDPKADPTCAVELDVIDYRDYPCQDYNWNCPNVNCVKSPGVIKYYAAAHNFEAPLLSEYIHLKDRDNCEYRYYGYDEYQSGRPFVCEEGVTEMATKRVRASDSDWLANVDAQAPRTDEARAATFVHMAQAEQASVASFSVFSMQLLAVAAPAKLVVAAHNAALDEVRHAQMCLGVAAYLRGSNESTVEVPGLLDAERTIVVKPDLAAMARATAVEGALGETLSTLVAAIELGEESDAHIAHVLRTIVADEARHAALAWHTLRWALREGKQSVRNALRDSLSNTAISAAIKQRRVPERFVAPLYDFFVQVRAYVIDNARIGGVINEEVDFEGDENHFDELKLTMKKVERELAALEVEQKSE